jgi:anthranilate 1,2-dioxygenase large subunit
MSPQAASVERTTLEGTAVERRWPEGGFTRVPAWIYSDEDIYRKELLTFFAGDTWNFVGLECEIPEVGSFKRTWIADRQVIVVRDAEGINVVENRCAHRGGAICWKNKGEVKDLTCPYHQWTYSLKGDLQGVSLKRGVHGEGGMPKEFDNRQHGLRKLRVARFGGSVWATFSDKVVAFEEYCGPEAIARLRRMMPGRPLRLLGFSRQLIPANWKLYFENTRDPYHGTLLHTFFVTFGLYRADSKHVTQPTRGGMHSVNYAAPGERNAGGDITGELKRFRADLKLSDMEMVRFVDEYGDGEMTAMQLFPGAFVQQHANILAMRHIIPKGVGQVEVDWTFFGYADDDENMQRIRLKQANLLGPSGFVSMDDSELLKQMNSQVTGYPESVGIVEMGGRDVQPQTTMATEVGIRAFYDYYRRAMGF